MRATSLAVAGLSCSLAACSAGPRAEQTRSRSTPVDPVSIAAPLVASSKPPSTTAATSAPVPAPTEQPPPRAWPFERLLLPDVGPATVVTGKASDDVWLLVGQNSLVHFDGTSATLAHERVCVQSPDNRTDLMASRPDTWTFRDVLLSRHDILLQGDRILGDGSWSYVAARLVGGKWRCELPGHAGAPPSIFPTTCPHSMWMTCFARQDFLVVQTSNLKPIGKLRFPTVPGSSPGSTETLFPTAVHRSCPDRALLATAPLSDPPFDLWELHGRTWRRLPKPDRKLQRLWQDDGGAVWALSKGNVQDEGWPPYDRLTRLRAGKWETLPVPTDFEAVVLHGHGGDLWMFGYGMAYRWNGTAIESGTMPVGAPEAAWSAPDGTLWVVGTTCSTDAKGHPKKCPAGAKRVATAARMLPSSGVP